MKKIITIGLLSLFSTLSMAGGGISDPRQYGPWFIISQNQVGTYVYCTWKRWILDVTGKPSPNFQTRQTGGVGYCPLPSN